MNSLRHVLPNDIDFNLASSVLTLVLTDLKNVSEFVPQDDPTKRARLESGESTFKIVPTHNDYYTISIYDIARSVIPHTTLEIPVRHHPDAVRQIVIKAKEHVVIAPFEKVWSIHIDLFFAGTSSALRSTLSPQYVAREYFKTVTMDLLKKLRTTETNIFPAAFYTNNKVLAILAAVADTIQNMSRDIGRINARLDFQSSWGASGCYVWLFENIHAMSYSFLEFLAQKFGANLIKVNFVQLEDTAAVEVLLDAHESVKFSVETRRLNNTTTVDSSAKRKRQEEDDDSASSKRGRNQPDAAIAGRLQLQQQPPHNIVHPIYSQKA